MSTIDERVVGMKFDGGQFQRGAADAMRTLSDLKKSVNFTGAANGLKELQTVGNGFHLGAMGNAIDNMVGRFSALQVAGVAALATLASSATTVGLQMARDLVFTQPMEGLREYETQINSIQTIQANTASKGTTMDEINAALAELNTYADKTIYNFGEMTRSIGTFTAAGLSLDTSVAAIKGLSNVAALAGTNSQQASVAMYQMSQAMSSGTVRLQDWMSLENAGMATEAFRNSLLETARVNGIAVDSLLDKHGTFRETLSEGWLTSDIMTQTLDKFTGDMSAEGLRQLGYTEEQIAATLELGQIANDAAQKVKTFTQLMGTLSEATASGWAQSWQIVLGDFEEARSLFTEISDIVGGMIGRSAEARNAQLSIWKDNGGRDAIIQSLHNAFTALMQVITPIGEAWAEVFPPRLGITLLRISAGIRSFTEGLMIGADGSERLHDVFVNLFKGLKFGTDILGAGISFLFSTFGSLFSILGGLFGLLAPLVDWFSELGGDTEESGQGIEDFTNTLIHLKDVVVGGLLTGLTFLQEVIRKLIEGDYSGIGNMFDGALEPIMNLARNVQGVWQGVMDWFQAQYDAAGVNLGNSWSGVMDFMTEIGQFIKDIAAAFEAFFAGFSEGADAAFANIDPTAVLAALNAGVLGGFVIAIFRAFNDVKNIFADLSGIVDSVAGALDGLTGVLAGMEARLKAEAVLKIAIAIGVLALALLVMSQIDPDRLVSSVTALATTFTIMMTALTVMDKIASGKGIARMPFIAASMLILSFAINILSLAMLRLSGMSWEDLAKGLTGIGIAIGLLLLASKAMADQEGQMIKAAAALLIFSAALYALVGVVAILGNMPMEVLSQGMAATAILITALVATAYLLGKAAPTMFKASLGLIAMSTALGMLAGVVIGLGLIPFEVLQQGLAVTGIMLLGLTTAAIILSQLAPKMAVSAVGMMAMAAALMILTIPILALGSMDMAVLAQGMGAVAIMLGVLVVAANSMKTAITGAGAMVVMAASLLLIAFAIQTLSAIPIEAVGVAMLAIAGVLTILGLAGLLIGPVLPALAGLAGVIVLLSIAFVIFAFAIVILAPALVALTGALVVFGQVADQVMQGVPAMLALAGALALFGVGAALAGAGAIILGAGLILMGLGLGMLATTGFLGIYVLVQLITQLGALAEHIPAMLGFGAALLVLGVGLTLLGVGMLALGLGVLAFAAGLSILVAVGAAAVPVITLLFLTMINLIPPFIAAIGAGISQAVELMRGKIPEFVQAAVDIIIGVLEGIRQVAPEVEETILVLIDTLIDTIVGAVDRFVTGGMELIEGILEGIADKIDDIVDAATDVVVEFLDAIGENQKRIVQAGFDLLIDIIDGITDAVKTNSRRVETAGWDLAAAIIEGVVGGIGRGLDRVATAARNMASQAFEAAMDFLNINSPSKLFMKGFESVPEGAALGIDRGAYQVVDSVETMGARAVSAMDAAMQAMHDSAFLETDIQPTVTPVLDLSNLKDAAGRITGLLPAPDLAVSGARNNAEAINADRLAQVDAILAATETEPSSVVNNFDMTQVNNSPKALSREEIWRDHNNQIARLRGVLDK